MLDDAQEGLLVDLVEADRSVAREQRQAFHIAETIGPSGVQIIHDGWRDVRRRVPKVDLQTLASAGRKERPWVGTTDGWWSFMSWS